MATRAIPAPCRFPRHAPVEGGSSSTGDRHVLVLDNGNCFLYELYNSSVNSDGSWNADSTAVWDLLGDEQRPYTWTSADAAGLPIFPGLVRYDEVAAGKIQHAFRFTLPKTSAAFTPPASHWAATSSDPTAPPMGMRLRLKSSYDISGFSAQMQVILTAMKTYGLILADNGSALFVTGVSDSRWGSDLDSLKTVPASAFEVVQMNPVYTNANYPTGAAPTISSFTASRHARFVGRQRDPVVECWQRRLRNRLARPGRGARHQRDRQSHSHDDLHALRDQSVRTDVSDGHRERPVEIRRARIEPATGPSLDFRCILQTRTLDRS